MSMTIARKTHRRADPFGAAPCRERRTVPAGAIDICQANGDLHKKWGLYPIDSETQLGLNCGKTKHKNGKHRLFDCLIKGMPPAHHNNQASYIAIRALLGAALLAGGLAGCATAPTQEEPPRVAWPSPPQTARIEFVRSIASEEDLRKDTTATQKVINWLSGVKPPPNRILEPMGIAVSDDGQRLYVSNFARQAVFAFDFRLKTFREIGPLAGPLALALDGQEQLYVVEQVKKQISVFDPAGNRVRSITHPDLVRPSGIALDRARARIYLADSGRGRRDGKAPGHDIKVFKLDGALIDTIGEGFGGAPGQFRFPTYLALDADGNLYVTDTLNSRVQVFDPDGKYVKKFGERGAAFGMFDKPKGVALDSFGNVYVVDSGWSNVQIFNQKGQVLLFFGGRGQLPGLLKNPSAVAIDASNNIYVADFVNHRINMYRLVNTTAEDSYLTPPAAGQGSNEAKPKQAGARIDDKPSKGGDL